MLPAVLDKRLADGLITQYKRDKIAEDAKRVRVENAAKMGREKALARRAATWEPIEKSLRISREVIREHVFGEGCAGWVVNMMLLQARAADYIEMNKTEKALPADTVKFWYDLDEYVDEYRHLVKTYPLGEHQCPLSVF